MLQNKLHVFAACFTEALRTDGIKVTSRAFSAGGGGGGGKQVIKSANTRNRARVCLF